MKQEPNFQYYIPAFVMFDDNLSPSAKLLYGVIVAMAHREGYCWASSNTLAKKFSCTRESVSRWLSDLEKRGFVRVEITKVSNRKIFIEDVTNLSQGCDENVTSGVTNISQGCDENVIKGVTNISQGRDENVTQNNITKNKGKNKNINKRMAHGEYKNVYLSDEEYEKLRAEFPTDWQNWIEKVSTYCQSTGKTYKDYLATIRNWARKENPKQKQLAGITPIYDSDSLQKIAEKNRMEVEQRRKEGKIMTYEELRKEVEERMKLNESYRTN